MKIFAGTSGYSYTEWVGSFYPKGLSARRMLKFYAEHFRSVEINATFYKLPKPSVVEAWGKEVPDDFKFVLKAPQIITHRERLKNSAVSVATFLELQAILGKRIGPVLFQLPKFVKCDAVLLRDFLQMLDGRCRAAFEFRNQTWFTDEVFSVLRKHKAALCIADAENELEVPFVATANWGYLRLRRENYSRNALKKWVKGVKEQRWKEAFVFFKHDDVGHGPTMAKQFLKLATTGDPKQQLSVASPINVP
jgi:uncharacterized protein YecE (DUF72 family)